MSFEIIDFHTHPFLREGLYLQLSEYHSHERRADSCQFGGRWHQPLLRR